MKPALRILSPGPLTSVQDLGRPGHQRLGVPAGGALDPVALRAGNALAGNAPDVGALECVGVGPTLIVEAESVRLPAVVANGLRERFELFHMPGTPGDADGEAFRREDARDGASEAVAGAHDEACALASFPARHEASSPN